MKRSMVMKQAFAIALLAVTLSAPGCRNAAGSRGNAATLTEDEKHRLYSAALAASESPLDADIFKDVCRKIGIFDAHSKPNEKYMGFVSEHVAWSMKPETEQFRQDIGSRDKAREYVDRHLPR